jgi:hypothetical protein
MTQAATALELRQSPVVHADETSWWVGRPGWWLWVFATTQMTLYVVIPSRAAAVARAVLGPAFGGVLVSDCLAIYDHLNPLQQKCYSQHLKAVSEALNVAASDYLFQVQALLRTALWLKALQGSTPAERFALCRNTLKAGAHALLKTPRAPAVEEKVRRRLWKLRDQSCRGGAVSASLIQPWIRPASAWERELTAAAASGSMAGPSEAPPARWAMVSTERKRTKL